MPKLSGASVVVFHDTNVRERGFGVYRLWDEVREKYPSFELLHCHGLGLLATGSQLPSPVRGFFAFAADESHAVEAREAYARLGAAIALEQTRDQLVQQLGSVKAEAESQAKEVGERERQARAKAELQAKEVGERERQASDLLRQMTERDDEIARLNAVVDGLQSARRSASNMLRQQMLMVGRMQREAMLQFRERAMVESQLKKRVRGFERSMSWRLTRPLRAIALHFRSWR